MGRRGGFGVWLRGRRRGRRDGRAHTVVARGFPVATDVPPEPQQLGELGRVVPERRSRVFQGQRAADGGFHAVIGNPPWIRQEGLHELKPLLEATFRGTYDSVADIYVHFLARGCQVLRPNARLGMIVPNKWFKAAYGEKLRAFLVEKALPNELIDFGHAPLFEDADTFPCILVLEGRCRRARAPPSRHC
jgi:Eco57I restriction-modification methylase